MEVGADIEQFGRGLLDDEEQDDAVAEIDDDMPEDDESDESDQSMAHPNAVAVAGGAGGPNADVIQAPVLLLRRSSISSLDESSQRGNNDSFCAQGNWAGDLTYSVPGGNTGFSQRHPGYVNTGHPSKTLNGLNDLRKNDQFTDVSLVANGIEVRAHKNVLASCSPYFYAMFTGFEESRLERVALGAVDPQALRILIDYIYTAKVDVNEDNVQTLLTTANLLQLNDVTEACCQFLFSQLHPTNALGIKKFADLHGCQELLNQAQAYIESHLTDILECEEFYNLKPEEVIELIASDTITVPSEEKVYESVLDWIKYDVEARSCFLPQLLEHVRLPLLSKEYLLQKVNPDGIFDAHPKCKDFIIEALKFHLSHGDVSRLSWFATSTSSLSRTKPRQPVGLPKVMLAIGGQAPKAIRSVECYDFKEERWFSITEMTGRRCRCGVAVVRGKVYAVGGFNGSLRVKTVDEYDPVRDRWMAVASMETRRSTLGVAVMNEQIYAVGGFDGSNGLNSAEYLDLSLDTKEWRPIACMSTRRSSVGVGVLSNLLYAVGGYDGNSRHCLASVEMYSPDTDTWQPVADMSARRSGAGVGILGGMLYAVGGHDGPLVRKSVECYNPERNVWRNVAEMNYCRRNAGVVAHNGLLYVVGGDDGTSNLQSVEVYNPRTDTWTMLPGNMTTGRSYTGVCIIDKPETF